MKVHSLIGILCVTVSVRLIKAVDSDGEDVNLILFNSSAAQQSNDSNQRPQSVDDVRNAKAFHVGDNGEFDNELLYISICVFVC